MVSHLYLVLLPVFLIDEGEGNHLPS
jgi:hypothetical protein